MYFSSKRTGPKCVFAVGVYKMKVGDQKVMIYGCKRKFAVLVLGKFISHQSYVQLI